MVKKENRKLIREKKHLKVRNRFSGTAERPRLSVYRSNSHIYAQVIDDEAGRTIVKNLSPALKKVISSKA